MKQNATKKVTKKATKKETKKATQKATKKVKQNYLCVDVCAVMNNRMIEPGEPRTVEVTTDEECELFTLREVMSKVHVEHPELHWRLLDRTKHGRATINARHVKVEFYIPHGHYSSSAELADLIASEVETMGENFSEMDLKEEAAQCLC